jgi:predicted nucleic acid-binding protein
LALYFDSSALVKLIFAEAESTALTAWMDGLACRHLISDLGRTETLRIARRVDASRLPDARAVLDSFELIRLGRSTFELAWPLGDPLARTLDALHLAVCSSFGPDLKTVVTYDRRMAEAARSLGLAVESPGDANSAQLPLDHDPA